MKFKIIKSLNGNRFKILAAVIVISLGGLWLAHRGRVADPATADPAAVPTAGVAKVTREDLFKEVSIYAEFRPYVEVALPAKVTGYVGKMNVDFGDKVKAGELLATIDVPELKDQLNSAQATEQKAEAEYTNAHLVYSRLQAVNKDHPNLVAQQDLDTAQANDLDAGGGR